ncbi:MAG: cation-translocating P-type ATPase [Clostridia bacterium]|nr:cation-translocating P-type ATPase [Clostridia bacterium]
MKHLLHEILEKLESIPATVIGGISLVASLLLPLILQAELPIYLDPAWIAIVISGIPLAVLAIKRIIKNKGISKISSALLITVGMIASVAIGDIFAAGEIAFIMAIGEILEDKTTARARKGLKQLISLSPVQGRKVTADGEIMIPAEDICVGDVLRILPGETIPVDGVILRGETSVDQSVMTGESLPVDKEAGDSVYSGTVNRFGAIDMEAVKVGEDSSLQRLIRMVEEADGKVAPTQRIADKWASWLVPVALLLAIISGAIKYFMGDPDFLLVAVTMLVVFCPCALVLATPTAVMAAIGQATKHGVIIKSGEALEKMGKVDTVAFDKTGTLTYGKPQVSDVVSLSEDTDEASLLSLAASAERRSEHPLGKAIVAYAKEKGVVLSDIDTFSMTAGKGVSATVNGRGVHCGNEIILSGCGISLDDRAHQVLDVFRKQGKVSIAVADDTRLLGVIALSDTLRPTSADMVARLEKDGVKALLLTGDNRQTAAYFAGLVGISEVNAELLPEDKVRRIEELEQAGRSVCMIGDGINDAPALKTATVGVAMGTMGSDIAVEAADIALVGDDISKIPYLKRLSRATVKTIKFSISLSLLINLAAIVLSFLEILTPTTGALVHNAGSVLVVLIAALLYDRKFD